MINAGKIMLFRFVCLFVILSTVLMQPAIADDLQVLPEEINGVKTENMMHVYLEKQSQECFDRWKQRFESLKTQEQIREYQKKIRKDFVESLGISFSLMMWERMRASSSSFPLRCTYGW